MCRSRQLYGERLDLAGCVVWAGAGQYEKRQERFLTSVPLLCVRFTRSLLFSTSNPRTWSSHSPSRKPRCFFPLFSSQALRRLCPRPSRVTTWKRVKVVAASPCCDSVALKSSSIASTLLSTLDKLLHLTCIKSLAVMHSMFPWRQPTSPSWRTALRAHTLRM